MNRQLSAVLAVAVFAVACESPTNIPTPESATTMRALPPAQDPGLGPTPLQGRIAQMIASRASRRMPAPEVKFEFHSAQGSSVAQIRSRRFLPGGGFSYTARTTLSYRGPRDAGLTRWPDMTLTPEQETRFGMTTAELRARYMALREAATPGIWQQYELGYEPRSWTISETETRTYPMRNMVPGGGAGSAMLAVAPRDAGVLDASSGNLAFGFSVILPKLEKHVGFSFLDVQSVSADFVADAGAGLRLPMSGAMSGDEPVNEGSLFSTSSALTGENWTGPQYANVGLPAEDGNEAYLNFVIQACVDLNGIIDEEKQCEGPNLHEAKDFTTPLGAGNLVGLPTINVPILDYGVVGLDFVLNSAIGSDKVTADWTVGGEGSGGGALAYSNSGTSVPLADALAIDGPGVAAITVDDFKYWFNQFTITPGVKLWISITIPFFPEDLEWDESWTIDIITINLFDLLPLPELAIPIHGSPYSGASSLALGIDIVNVTPTADAAVAGGTAMVINGVPTIVGNTGEPFTFTGTSFDPGRDDLTMTWDWGDGAPVPDVSTLHALGAPVGPNNAVDVKVHAFSQSCMYAVTLRSTDDDAAFAEDGVEILVTESGQPARFEGYWQKQMARSGGNLLDVAVIGCYLRIVERVSTIFNEHRAASTLAEALAVLDLPHNTGSEVQQLDREILVTWLNFAAGAVQYQQLVDTNGDGVPDTAFDQVMATAEAVRLNPASTAAALRAQSELLHKVSEQFVRP